MKMQTSTARGSMTFPRIVAPTMDVVPASPGLKLRHPIDGLLPDEGGKWTRDQFTFRLLLDGTLVEPPAPEAPPVRAPDAASEPPHASEHIAEAEEADGTHAA